MCTHIWTGRGGKMDRISFQPLHWDNREQPISHWRLFSPFSIFARDQTRDIYWEGGGGNQSMTPSHRYSLLILHFFFYVHVVNVFYVWCSMIPASSYIYYIYPCDYRWLAGYRYAMIAFPLDLLLITSSAAIAINKLWPISSHPSNS